MGICGGFTFLVNGEKLSLSEISTCSEFSCRLSDSSITAEIKLHTLRPDIFATNWCIFHQSYLIANSDNLLTSISQADLDSVKRAAVHLADDRNELWPHSHRHVPNSRRERVRDTGLQTKMLLDQLSSDLHVLNPPEDHNKIGCKKFDITDFSELHVDRFGGMRHGTTRVRRRISRHFINLGDTTRYVVFAIMDPNLVDRHVPDEYSPTYLDNLIEALGKRITLLCAPIIPRWGPRVAGVRYLSSHLLHVEYGFAGDFCAVVNSDSELRGEEIGV